MGDELQTQPVQGDGNPAESADGWTTPQPERVPRQTYMPATLALGVTVLLWGLVTTYILTAIGLALIILSMVFWIGDIRHEH